MKLLRDDALNQEDWDAALQDNTEFDFLQSWTWGEFHQSLGHPIWRLAVEDNGIIIAQILVIQLSLGYGQNVLYSPHGNFINKHLSLPKVEEATRLLLPAIEELGQQTGALCFRVDPLIPQGDLPSRRYYLSRGFVENSHKHIQPKHTILIDLTKNLRDILNSMKPKTRYNINVAQKHEVEVVRDNSPKALTEFLAILKETSGRNKFFLHSDKYYISQHKILSNADMQDLYLASFHDKTIAGILINKFNGRATYVHGASRSEHRELMAPYLLHYTVMSTLQNEGLHTYDLGGIHPDPDHPWSGITRFKRGFGGTEVEYAGVFELPLKPFIYRVYSFIQKFR